LFFFFLDDSPPSFTSSLRLPLKYPHLVLQLLPLLLCTWSEKIPTKKKKENRAGGQSSEEEKQRRKNFTFYLDGYESGFSFLR